MAKKFMFICFGILALASAYAVGANNSVAQVGGSDVVQAYTYGGATVVVTANGDFYARHGCLERFAGNTVPSWGIDGAWAFKGNCFSGAVSSQENSLGGVKSLFR